MSDIFSNLVASDSLDEQARIDFVIRAALSGVRTSIPVRVKAVTNDGGVSPIGYVTLEPLVGALDGTGVIWPYADIDEVPYMRIQGGSNAVILDPQVGDIGLATVCDRDISTVKQSQDFAPPGSLRKFDFSDMVYLMTIIGAAPTQYVQFNASGINVVSPNAVQVKCATAKVSATTSVTIDTPSTTVTGALQVDGQLTGSGGMDISGGSGANVSGNMNISGDVTASDAVLGGKSVVNHDHTDPQGGTVGPMQN